MTELVTLLPCPHKCKYVFVVCVCSKKSFQAVTPRQQEGKGFSTALPSLSATWGSKARSVRKGVQKVWVCEQKTGMDVGS